MEGGWGPEIRERLRRLTGIGTLWWAFVAVAGAVQVVAAPAVSQRDAGSGDPTAGCLRGRGLCQGLVGVSRRA